MPQISTLPSQVADLCAAAWLCLVAGVCQALESSLESSNGDSASGEQCGSVAKIVKGTNAKFANLPQFLQSYHSPTANLRILEEENNQTELDSSVQVDSKETSAIAERYPLFCHADKSARNDDKAQNLNESIKDSRICDEKSGFCERVQGRILGVCNRRTRDAIHDLSRKAESSNNAQNVFCSQVDRRQDFCDKNGALQGESKARTWACVTADSPQQSPFLAKKPTPKQQPKDSRSFTQNAQNLSKPQAEAVEMRNRCFQAVGAGIYLSGNEQAHRAEIKGLSRKAQSSNNAENMFCSHATRRQDLR